MRADHAPSLAEAQRDVLLIGRACREGWPIPPDTRARALAVVDAVLALPIDGATPRILSLQLLAVRTLGLLDSINVRRERNSVASEGQHLGARTARLRALLMTPQGCAALASLTECEAQAAAGSPPSEIVQTAQQVNGAGNGP